LTGRNRTFAMTTDDTEITKAAILLLLAVPVAQIVVHIIALLGH
jgi:hypothetical protein